MWTVHADGSGNRPLYEECEQEWVTHEVITTPDFVYFNVMAHLPRLRKKPTGIFSINLRNDEVKVLGQVSEGRGFWHCNGSADGKWAAGDNFEGSIYLVNLETSEISLLTTGHLMRPDHTHPTFSPDGKQILFQSGMLSGGQSLDLMLVNVTE
jgi:oligogalacturonide lyase